MRLVLASNNAKKLAELQTLFVGLGVELVNQASLGVAEADEPYATFVENALAKARHAAAACGSAAIADDSGLCVDALGGAPGVGSAHAAGLVPAQGEREHTRAAQDAANNRWLLEQLRGHTDRHAHYLCTLVALRSADDPEPLIASGRWAGVVLDSARGDGGFGYDPLIWLPDQGCSVAELDPGAKAGQSHRARAAARMRALIAEHWRLDG